MFMFFITSFTKVKQLFALLYTKFSYLDFPQYYTSCQQQVALKAE